MNMPNTIARNATTRRINGLGSCAIGTRGPPEGARGVRSD